MTRAESVLQTVMAHREGEQKRKGGLLELMEGGVLAVVLQDLEEEAQSLNILQDRTPLSRHEIFIVRERRCHWRRWSRELEFKVIILALGERWSRQQGRSAPLGLL
jgi:hypothetical protein